MSHRIETWAKLRALLCLEEESDGNRYYSIHPPNDQVFRLSRQVVEVCILEKGTYHLFVRGALTWMEHGASSKVEDILKLADQVVAQLEIAQAAQEDQ